MGDAKIIQFPARPGQPGQPLHPSQMGRVRSCFDCVFYLFETSHCDLYDERIDSELFAARDCDGYETEGDES